jgi:hypothetical protein
MHLIVDGANVVQAATDVVGGAIVSTGGTQTLTNKTLTSPAISTINNTGVLTLPTSTDTLVGRATTDTLTNKTLNIANNTLTGVAPLASPALSGTPTAPTAAAGTNTTQLATTAFVHAERTNTATLTNKTLTSPTITGGTINNTPIGGTTANTGTFTTALVGNGTAADPAFTFTGDDNTGIFRPAADTVALSTNGSERMRIADNGKILAAAGTNWVGTVSQNGQSSIIERGSNANGEFVKYADGTLICTKDAIGENGEEPTIASGDGFISTDRTWTFPTAFVNTNYVFSGARKTGTASQPIWLCSNSSPGTDSTTTSVGFRVASFVSSSQGYTHSLSAIGRWY